MAVCVMPGPLLCHSVICQRMHCATHFMQCTLVVGWVWARCGRTPARQLGGHRRPGRALQQLRQRGRLQQRAALRGRQALQQLYARSPAAPAPRRRPCRRRRGRAGPCRRASRVRCCCSAAPRCDRIACGGCSARRGRQRRQAERLQHRVHACAHARGKAGRADSSRGQQALHTGPARAAGALGCNTYLGCLCKVHVRAWPSHVPEGQHAHACALRSNPTMAATQVQATSSCGPKRWCMQGGEHRLSAPRCVSAAAVAAMSIAQPPPPSVPGLGKTLGPGSCRASAALPHAAWPSGSVPPDAAARTRPASRVGQGRARRQMRSTSAGAGAPSRAERQPRNAARACPCSHSQSVAAAAASTPQAVSR